MTRGERLLESCGLSYKSIQQTIKLGLRLHEDAARYLIWRINKLERQNRELRKHVQRNQLYRWDDPYDW